jgi:NADH dehydrogenase
MVTHLKRPGVELVLADLMKPETLDAACRGAGAVIATANAVAPTHDSTFEAVDDRGYAALLEACGRNGCGRFVLISVPETPHDAAVPLFRTKRLIEQRLYASGL